MIADILLATLRSMKILNYCARMRLEDGGVVRAVLDQCHLLTEAGHDVTLLCVDATDVPDVWRDGGEGTPSVEVLGRFDRSFDRFSKRSLDRIDTLIGDHDVLHLHMPWEHANLQLAKVATNRKCPYIVTVHGMLDTWCLRHHRLRKSLYMKFLGSSLLNGAAAVHLTASEELAQAQRWFRKGLGEVIPLSFDLSPYRQLPGPELAMRSWPVLTRSEPTLLFLSRIHPKKGVDVLIDAAAILRSSGHAVSTVIAGPCDDPQYLTFLRDRVDALELSDHVSFVGEVSGAAKYSLYQAADLFVLPTHQENFGFVLPEAMASGTPIITTRGVDTWPELQASGGAVIIDAPVPSLLAEAIGPLLDDAGRRGQLGAAAQQWARETFGGSAILDRYVALYEAAASGGGA